MIIAERYHDISCGHRVVNHESKCANLHGHNYRFHFSVAPNESLDSVGRVLDFAVIKAELCEWLEMNWDHKMLIWSEDPMIQTLKTIDPHGIVEVTFNPTAENLAKHFTEEIASDLLKKHNCKLIKCRIEETRKCSVTYKTEE